jgi:protein gp37
MSTNIQWTDKTDNIIVVEDGGWWCRKISEGCANCYAAKLNQSAFFGGNKLAYTGAPPPLKLRTDVIDKWERQRTPQKHFVASMTDIFGDWVPFDWAVCFLRGMWRAPKQTFQLLTKRPDVARKYIERWLKMDGLMAVPENIWIGASAENQKRYDERKKELSMIPATLFWSLEPLLGPIDMDLENPTWNQDHYTAAERFNWVIIGGESGSKARPCDVTWIASLVKQCKEAGVAAFVKQLGAQPRSLPTYCGDGSGMKLKDRKGGEMREWPKELQVRQFPI